MSHGELLGRVRGLLAGRAAEELVFGEVSTGASDDLEKASQIVRTMLTVYGMSKQLPNLSLVDRSRQGYLGQGPDAAPHSDEIERAIGEELLETLKFCYREAKELLNEKRDQLDTLAQRLLAQEKLDEHDLLDILGPRGKDSPTSKV